MCGRYFRRSDKQRIADAFHVTSDLAHIVLPPWDYNVAPTTHQPVIRAGHNASASGPGPERELTLMRWGLVPHFARDPNKLGYSTINARAESISTSPTFRDPFERRRCLVPADGFYEWKQLPAKPAEPTDFTDTLFGPTSPPTSKPRKKSDATAKQPHAFTHTGGEPFAFAGLWDRWRDPSGAWLESYAIITTTPNELTATVHNRMPVILAPQDYDLWLSYPPPARRAAPAPPLELLALLRPYPADRMTARPAHPDVGNVRNNHPDLLNSA